MKTNKFMKNLKQFYIYILKHFLLLTLQAAA